MAVLWLTDVTSVIAEADFLERSLKKSALTSRGKNLSLLTKLKNSLRTNLSQLSTLILNKPQMPHTKTTFLPIKIFTQLARYTESDHSL